MNDNELVLKKIEKKEKTDTILAYILIVCLIGAIAFMIYIKFIRKEESDTLSEEYTVNYITLDYIATKLEASSLVNSYLQSDKEVSVVNNNNSISFSYKDDDNDIKLDMPFENNELLVEVNDNNKVISEDIYKEIASIICEYNNSLSGECRNYLKDINSDDNINGIRFVKNNDSTYVYINILEKFEINNNEE